MYQLIIFLLTGIMAMGQMQVIEQQAVVPPADDSTQSVEQRELTSEDLMTYQPNEMGGVVVAMYHNLVDDEAQEKNYARTPDNLRKDLQYLWEKGYVPVSMSDYITGNIDIPIGKSPVVFTFDDGHITNFNVLADGEIDPNCVVGIFEQFYSEHPDFKPQVTFYLNKNIFFGNGDTADQKLEFIKAHDNYVLANHTAYHKNLKKMSKSGVAQAIVEQGDELKRMTGQTTFHFSVPFGVKPKQYQAWLAEDGFLGDYQMLSSVNVGWNPAPSPYHKDFNRLSINRITCGEDDFELYYWLKLLEDQPGKRYISDGDVRVVAIPQAQAKHLSDQAVGDKQLVAYDKDGNYEH